MSTRRRPSIGPRRSFFRIMAPASISVSAMSSSFESRLDERKKTFKKGATAEDAKKRIEEEAQVLRQQKKDAVLQEKRVDAAGPAIATDLYSRQIGTFGMPTLTHRLTHQLAWIF